MTISRACPSTDFKVNEDRLYAVRPDLVTDWFKLVAMRYVRYLSP